jgi:AP-3 complex subunit beta
MCQNITKFDPYAQVFIIRSLTIYSRYCFKNPETEVIDESAAAFWDENPQATTISADHLLLIQAVKRLLSSPVAAVVMAAVAYLYYCAPSGHLSAVAKPLVRLLYETQITAEISLTTILTIANS